MLQSVESRGIFPVTRCYREIPPPFLEHMLIQNGLIFPQLAPFFQGLPWMTFEPSQPQCPMSHTINWYI